MTRFMTGSGPWWAEPELRQRCGDRAWLPDGYASTCRLAGRPVSVPNDADPAALLAECRDGVLTKLGIPSRTVRAEGAFVAGRPLARPGRRRQGRAPPAPLPPP